MVLSSAAMGGVAAWTTGGKFLQGALNGMTVGLFNHGAHPGEIYRDENGELRCDLRPVECIGKRQTYIKDVDGALTVASYTNVVIDVSATTFENYAQNSSVGNNFKFYWNNTSKSPFYGNQYVKTVQLASLGKDIANYTGKIGWCLGGTQIIIGGYEDYQIYKTEGYTDGYNTVHASGSLVGGWAGALIGMKIGAAIGAPFGGAGAIPGAIIGGIIVGIGCGWGGSWLGGEIVDVFYGK